MDVIILGFIKLKTIDRINVKRMHTQFLYNKTIMTKS